MNKEKVVGVFLGFLEEEVLSKTSEFSDWLGSAILYLASPLILKKIEDNRAKLEMLGVLNGDEVDIDRLNAAVSHAFAHRAQLPVELAEFIPVLDVKTTFTQKDAEEFARRLRDANK